MKDDIPRVGQPGPPAYEDMAQWRGRFLGMMLRFSFWLGALVAVPSVGAALRDGMWPIVVMDLLALLAILALWRMGNWPYRLRATGFVAMVYLMGTFFLVAVGPVSLIYLMAFPVMVSLLLGFRPAVAALVLNAVTLLSVGYLANADLDLPGFSATPFLKWVIITLNFSFADAMITMACAMTLRRLRESLDEVRGFNAGLEERVRQRTAQLQAANDELASFSYAVSHDLRAPLGTIDGFTGLISRQLDPQDERSRHYVSRVRTAVRRMSELIDAMLLLAQVSRASLQWEAVDLSAMASGLMGGLREQYPTREVQFSVQPDMLATGDARLLRQVLENLLGNAWKFSASSPHASIAFSRQVGPGGEDVYMVRDNGTGFDMAHAGKLFNAFHRLHTPEEFAGNGIGLATVHKIILRHGGRVWAQAAPGQGAAFFFTLGAAPSGR